MFPLTTDQFSRSDTPGSPKGEGQAVGSNASARFNRDIRRATNQ